MKVKELVELLEGMEPEANVYIASQPRRPMEYNLRGVVQRSDFDEDASGGAKSVTSDGVEITGDDVILVEGAWIQYGDRDAWEAC